MASRRIKITPKTQVDEWNANHPVGTPVIRYKAMNPPVQPVETTTQSQAFVYRSAACVMVEGVIGSVNLKNLVPKRRTSSHKSKTKKVASNKKRVAKPKTKKPRKR